MRTLILLLTGALICSNLLAQNVIVRQRNGTPQFFYSTALDHTSLLTAFSGAQNGDTIYLPGVTYTLAANVPINSRVVIIGTGAHPDSATVAGVPGSRTTIACGGWNIEFRSGSDFSEMHGIVVTSSSSGGIYFGNSNATANRTGMIFKRCLIDYLTFGYTSSNNTSATNNMVDESRIVNMRVYNAQFTTIRNSIINSLTYAGQNTTVRNCLFLDFNQSAANNNANALYLGNIFLRNTTAIYNISEASTFTDNLWVLGTGSQVFWPGALSQSGSMQTTLIGNVFQGNTSYNTFAWTNNYQLVPGSPYLTMVGGTDQAGIYGGLSPWKDGLLPFNPSWREFQSPSATQGGTLPNVTIGASAQTH